MILMQTYFIKINEFIMKRNKHFIKEYVFCVCSHTTRILLMLCVFYVSDIGVLLEYFFKFVGGNFSNPIEDVVNM